MNLETKQKEQHERDLIEAIDSYPGQDGGPYVLGVRGDLIPVKSIPGSPFMAIDDSRVVITKPQ